jgi:hypothetical protein
MWRSLVLFWVLENFPLYFVFLVFFKELYLEYFGMFLKFLEEMGSFFMLFPISFKILETFQTIPK